MLRIQEYPPAVLASLTPSSSIPATATPLAPTAPTPFSFSQPGETHLFTIVDPEIARENPVEAKHRRLVRSHRNGPLDRELKPNAKIRDELNVRPRFLTLSCSPTEPSISQEILRYPPTQTLTAPQRDLVWQFRFYLTRDKRALTKFLKSVVWSDSGEVKQAVETLLPMWAEVEMDDALELLGPGEGFRDQRVRAYAVLQLGKADDDVSRLLRSTSFRADDWSAAGTHALPPPTRASPQV